MIPLVARQGLAFRVVDVRFFQGATRVPGAFPCPDVFPSRAPRARFPFSFFNGVPFFPTVLLVFLVLVYVSIHGARALLADLSPASPIAQLVRALH